MPVHDRCHEPASCPVFIYLPMAAIPPLAQLAVGGRGQHRSERCASFARTVNRARNPVGDRCRCLPVEADGATGKGDIVARLNAVQVFKEETTTGEAVLQVVLRLQ